MITDATFDFGVQNYPLILYVQNIQKEVLKSETIYNFNDTF